MVKSIHAGVYQIIIGTMDFLTKLKGKLSSAREHRIHEEAEDVYQLCEHDELLWITYRGVRVIPECMLYDDAITTLHKLREIYISEMTNQKYGYGNKECNQQSKGHRDESCLNA